MVEIKHNKGWFKNKREVELFYQSWTSEVSHSSLIILHGVGEHSGRYKEFAEFVVSQKIDVYAFDLQGYGQSGGRRGHISSFRNFTEDVYCFLKFLKEEKSLMTQQPIFLLGHSLGAIIALRSYFDFPEINLTGLILTGPPFKINLSIPMWWHRFLFFMATILPSFTIREESIKLEMLTHDTLKQDEFRRDPYRHYHRSLRFVREFFKAQKLCFRDASKISLPFLILQGGRDSIVDVRRVRDFYAELKHEAKSLVVYPSMYHEVLNELDRSIVFKDIVWWIKSNLTVKAF